MTLKQGRLKIGIIAGESSGDTLGASLMAALKNVSGDSIEFIGVGGPLMADRGLESLFPITDIAVMGVFEVVPRLPRILSRIRQTVRYIQNERPDILVTIDSPDFCFRVVKQLRESGVSRPSLVHYGAPTVWAWRPERAQKVAALYDGMMCLYPFEPPYFEAAGMEAAFVGHPMMASVQDETTQNLRRELEIPETAPVLGLLFGSRIGELNRMGPILRQAAEALVRHDPNMRILAPTLPHLRAHVKNYLYDLPCKTHVLTAQSRKWAAFATMDRALATSGTVGLELAVAGVPHTIGYKINTLTWRLIKSKVTAKYAHLANILLDRLLVPEYIQHDCQAENLVKGLMTLDETAQKQGFAEVRMMLAGHTKDSPATQAAHFVLGQDERASQPVTMTA